MACIKYLSSCPCPCCLLPKSKIPLLGSKSDKKARYRLIRVDTERRREKIETARRMIFEGVNITNRNVEYFLQDESLVPTRVSFYLLKNLEVLTSMNRMLSQKGFLNTALIFIRCLYRIYSMSLSLECGRQHSLTSCVFYMPMEMIQFRV